MSDKFSAHLMFEFCNQLMQKQGFSINDLQQNFIIIWQCVHCQRSWKDPLNFDLFEHLQECPKQKLCFEKDILQLSQNLQPFKLEPTQQKNENENNFQSFSNHEQLLQFDSHSDVENEVERILVAGNLSDGSRKQYKGPIRRFYKLLWQMQKCHPSCVDILNYIQIMKSSLHELKALSRLRKIEKIILKEDEQIFLKETKQILIEGKKQRPNTSWEQQTIQEFIDDLVLHKMETVAFRIFILYYLGGRISQITFQQICSGVVVYLPKKQIKQGSKAERILDIPLHVITVTKHYMELQHISPDQQLNIGEYKKSIPYNAMQKQLQLALLFLQQSKSHKTKEYLKLLQNFSYHDLRHSKLSHLYDQGAGLPQIQEFVKHSDQKCTKAYLKCIKNRKMNLNAQIIDMDKTQTSFLNLEFYPKEN